MFCSGLAMASTETWICLKNETGERKLILVRDIDNFDWDGLSRPDHNWNGTYVEAGKTRCERAEVNNAANPPTFSFIINGAQAAHKSTLKFTKSTLDHNTAVRWIVYVGSDPSTSVLRGNIPAKEDMEYEVGKRCDGVGQFCREFFIKDVP